MRPPPAWLADGLGQPPPAAALAGPSSAPALTVQQLDDVGRLLDEDDARQGDLAQQLRVETGPQYAQQPAGWPPLLSVVQHRQLPSVVEERVHSRQVFSLCGLFPEIHRAWATVDNALFLWRYDVDDVAPLEFAVPDVAIVNAALGKPRPGVFYSDITHVLVLATATELTLVGVHVSADMSSLSLQELPLYSCPSDGVFITACCVTPPHAGGRILLGASDGQLHELRYSADATWRSRRCTKTCYAPTAVSLLPRSLRPWLLGQPAAVRQVLVDAVRGVAYTRAGDGTLTLYDLGVACAPVDGNARRVDEIRPPFDALLRRDGYARGSSTASGSSAGIPRHGAPGGVGGSTGRAAAALPVAMALVSPEESTEVCLVVIFSDGRRIYLSIYARGAAATHRTVGWAAPQAVSPTPPAVTARPIAFRAVAAARDSPPHASTARPAPTAGAAVATPPAPRVGAAVPGPPPGVPFPGAFDVGPPLRVDAAFSADGLLLMTQTEAGSGASTLLACATDAAGSGSPGAAVGPLREVVMSLPLPGVLAGDSAGLAELPFSQRAAALLPAGLPRSAELATQQTVGPRNLLVLTSAGVSLLRKARPVDTLDTLLASGVRHHVESFFATFGHSEAAAMCVWLALQHNDPLVRSAARRCLDDTRLCGEARMSGDDIVGGVTPAPSLGAPGVNAPQLMNMGTSVVAHQPVFSAAYAGCCLAARRLLRPCWRRALVAPLAVGGPQTETLKTSAQVGAAAAADAGTPLQLCMATTALADLESRCRALAGLVSERAGRAGSQPGRGGMPGSTPMGALSPPWTAGGVGVVGPGAAAQAAVAAASHEAMAKRRRLEDADSAERHAYEALGQTLVRAADALAVLRLAACPPHAPHSSSSDAGSIVAAQRYFPAATCRVPVGSPARDVLRTRSTLRVLSTSSDGEAACAALVEAMREQALAEGGASAARALADALAVQGRSFFSPDRATLFEARNALDAASVAPRGVAKEGAIARALDLLLTVPSTVPVTRYAEELARLKAWPQLVELCLAVARSAAEDPVLGGGAMAGAPQLNAAQHPRVIQAASCVAEVVTALATPPPPPPPPTATTSNAQPGAVNNTAPAQGAPAATSSGVAAAAVFELATADARLEALGSLLQAAGAALSRRLQAGAMVNGDAIPLPPGEAATSCVASALFGALVDASAARAAGGHLDCTPLVLGIPPDCGLDAWLLTHGRLDDASTRRLPLTHRQARLLLLAAERAAGAKRFALAARLMRVLGLRAPPPPGELALSLSERTSCLTRAVMWAEVAPSQQLSPDEAAEIGAQRIVLAFQERLAAAAAGADGVPEVENAQVQAQAQAQAGDGGPVMAAGQLRPLTVQLLREPLPLSTLFNDVALDPRLQCLDVAIEMFAFSGVADTPDRSVAKPLWDGLLAKAVASAAGAAAQLAAACEAVVATGGAAYPSEAAVPLAHVALRLEQIAHAKWPPSTAPQTPPVPLPEPDGAQPFGSGGMGPVATALLAACRGSAEPALGAVQQALTQSGSDVADPALRFALLRTLLHLAQATAQPLRRGMGASFLGPPGMGDGMPYGRTGGMVRTGSALRARLAEVCDVSAAEARRLQVQGTAALAAQFEALQRELLAL